MSRILKRRSPREARSFLAWRYDEATARGEQHGATREVYIKLNLRASLTYYAPQDATAARTHCREAHQPGCTSCNEPR